MRADLHFDESGGFRVEKHAQCVHRAVDRGVQPDQHRAFFADAIDVAAAQPAHHAQHRVVPEHTIRARTR